MLDALKDRLIRLDALECMGKQHFQKYGKNMTDIQCLYLMSHPAPSHTVSDLYTPSALSEQERIRASLQKTAKSRTLSPQDFFTDGKNLEIEKLLRYVDIPPHQHDFIECAYVVCGRCVHQINDRNYLQEAGSFVAIPFGFTHALYPEEDCLCLTIKIRHETFQKMQFPGLMDFVYPLAFSCGDDPFVRHSIASIWDQQEQALPFCDQIEEQLFQTMMFYIAQRFHDDVQYLVSGAIQDKRMIEILSYMLDNYQTITLQSVANHFHYNASYLSRIFHQQTGLPFSAILKEFKLRQAAKLLSERKWKLEDVCEEIGYKDVTQFIRSFKELYGITPAKYCTQMNQEAQAKK